DVLPNEATTMSLLKNNAVITTYIPIKLRFNMRIFGNQKKLQMSFKKLIEPLNEALKIQGFETPLPFQKQVLSKIKSGANVFGIAPKGSGKTTAMVMGVVQNLKGEAFEDAPRAIVFAKDKEAVLELH